jgi:hypothetical protein
MRRPEQEMPQPMQVAEASASSDCRDIGRQLGGSQRIVGEQPYNQ